ncbi:MAG: xanthine dehydrogenase family protein molybdopterin-binding subunit [Siphonobacter aquaeclarae]|nr:xanthine dehydrogenase family protein molybdopterin-binding subunit [Siphonobacter aquaeclarae]
MKPQHTSRRDFLKAGGSAGALLALGFSLPAQAGDVVLHKIEKTALGLELSPYILIDDTGKITLLNPRPDMGQGTYQSMPALIAEELEVSFDQIHIIQTNGQGKYGAQLSGGSSSVRTRWIPMRKAGAAVREMLIQAAANKWKVPVAECFAENAKVIHRPSGKSFPYAELVEEASRLEIPKEPKLKDPKDFKLLGKNIPKPDVPLKVTGRAQFGIDVEVPGMLYASIERSPSIHGKVISFDDAAALKVPGVKKVLKAERAMPHLTVETVAVVATNYWAAMEGRRKLKVQWEKKDPTYLATDTYSARLKELAGKESSDFAGNKGDFAAAYAGAARKIQASYETPFAAHAAMEPVNATAWFKGDSLEIWAPTQGPDGTISELARYLNLKPEQVKVNVTFLGGAFGRKAYLDFVKEAAFLSKAVGAPVKLLWTREDDMTQGPYRPAMLSVLEGGIDAQGKITAFHYKIITESIQEQVFKADLKGKADGWTEEGIGEKDSPIEVPNIRRSYLKARTDLPIVWWRSVYASTNVFGHESFIDELAHAAGRDPLDLRLELFKDSPRFVKVLETLAEKSGYRQKRPAGKAMGIAIARSFSTICAHAFTVAKTKDGVKIEKVVSVIDCGMVVNPDNVRAQTESNVVYGLTAALKGPITYADGAIQQSNFHNYPVLRLPEMPKVEVHIIDNQEAPGGVGEPGLPPIAPALANALFNLTGKRVRKLPMELNG